MEKYQLDIICPDCGQPHAGCENPDEEKMFLESGCGFAVCFKCASIFGLHRTEERMLTLSLNSVQLMKMAETQPKMYSELLHASNEVKKRRSQSQKN